MTATSGTAPPRPAHPHQSTQGPHHCHHPPPQPTPPLLFSQPVFSTTSFYIIGLIVTLTTLMLILFADGNRTSGLSTSPVFISSQISPINLNPGQWTGITYHYILCRDNGEWELSTGPTPTHGTGPSEAAEVNNYI